MKLAFSRLRETVRLNHDLIHWQNPKSEKSFEDVKQVVLSKLTEEARTALRQYALEQVAQSRRPAAEQNGKSRVFHEAVQSLNSETLSWIVEQ